MARLNGSSGGGGAGNISGSGASPQIAYFSAAQQITSDSHFTLDVGASSIFAGFDHVLYNNVNNQGSRALQFYKDRADGGTPNVQQGDVLGEIMFNANVNGSFAQAIGHIDAIYQGDGTTTWVQFSFSADDSLYTNHQIMTLDPSGLSLSLYDYGINLYDRLAANGRPNFTFNKDHSEVGGSPELVNGDTIGGHQWNGTLTGGGASLLQINGYYRGDSSTQDSQMEFSIGKGSALSPVLSLLPYAGDVGYVNIDAGLLYNTKDSDTVTPTEVFQRQRAGGAAIHTNDILGDIQFTGNVNGTLAIDLAEIIATYIGSGTNKQTSLDFKINTGSASVYGLRLFGIASGLPVEARFDGGMITLPVSDDTVNAQIVTTRTRASGANISTNDVLAEYLFKGFVDSGVRNLISMKGVYIGSGTTPDYRSNLQITFKDVLGNDDPLTIDSKSGYRYFETVCFDFTVDVATGDGASYVHVPAAYNGMKLVEVHALVITAGTTNTTDVQLHNVTDNVDMLTTPITIDSGETGSDTAATPPVIDGTNNTVATNDVLRVDVDAVSTTAPKGLIVTMGFKL